ncbi:MAG: hypothetical protein IJ449_12940 [Clostridia bacterium]|nr:hypothetical protein [Clostridia bacterium]
MNHPDRTLARRFADTLKCEKATDVVYSGKQPLPPSEMYAKMFAAAEEFAPKDNPYHVYFGELHGHTNLSDGAPDIDTYFTRLRDVAKLDFAALSDHDHGGLSKPSLWEPDDTVPTETKWDYIKEKVKEYNAPGTFTTILAYERDSYPFYDNMVVYYNSHDGEMIRGAADGMITKEELAAVLARDDVFVAPHDTYSLDSGADLAHMPVELLPSHLEIISRGDCAEYMNHPAFDSATACEGGFWQDALARGGKTAVIAASDDHSANNGLVVESLGYPAKYPGVTGVWAEENTLPALFDALKKKRCYGFMRGDVSLPMHGNITVDFRIGEHFMGEEFTRRAGEDLVITYSVKADAPVKRATIVKNCRDYIMAKSAHKVIVDSHQENETDVYYLRVELTDGRFAWTSPIWVKQE